MEVGEVLDRVKTQFGDTSGVQIDDEKIIRWINDAQKAIVQKNETILQEVTTVDLTEAVNEYSFPTDLLVLRSLRYKTTSMKSYIRAEPLSLSEFDRRVDGWDGTAFGNSSPCVYTTYKNSIFLFPTPNQNVTDGLKILYSRKPTDVSVSSDELDVPYAYETAVVEYCLSRAMVLDEEYETSLVHRKQFNDDVNLASFKESISNRETYPTITPRLEDL